MATIKSIAYDWLGGNEQLFWFINGNYNDVSDKAAVFLNAVADHHHFPYIMLGLFGIALLDYIVRTVSGRAGTKQRLVSWLGVFLVLGAGYCVEGETIKFLKDYFGYMRPFALWPESVHVLEVRTDINTSFPSGHAAFITMMVIGLLPVLTPFLRSVGALLILAVCWARVASGVHFPADVLGAVFLMVVLIPLVRSVIHSILRTLFGLRC